MKKLLLTMAIAGLASVAAAQNSPVLLNVDASQKIATASKLFNGANIEDINNQTNGGIFSQLLHGEAFEENVDTDFLNLDRADYSKIYIMLDERRIPHLITQSDVYTRVNWNNLTEKYDFHSKDVYNASKFRRPHVISGYSFPTRFLVFDSLPEDIQRIMLERVNGNEQISKFWSKLTAGSPQYDYKLVRDGQASYMGRQTQRISFVGGSGEVGITNHGLYRIGIHFETGKSYDGIIRIKADRPTTVYLSLRSENGSVLAEKPYSIKGDGTYEKLEFELIPDSEALEGCFGISLKAPGQIELGYAFLQPGEWGRVDGYPLRKKFVDMLKRQGITAIRYNGSMVDVGADTYNYRWKKMLGPIDERRITYRSGFSPYATHSFAFIEMLQLAEVLGAECIIGMSMDETSEDIHDFVEYVNGPVTSKWGALRAEHGHPEPYNLKYIQVDNERILTPGYLECMKKFARAAWKADPEMTIMTSLNLHGPHYTRGTVEYQLSSDMVKWFLEQGKGDKLAWDPHFNGGSIGFANADYFTREMALDLQAELAKDYPGFKLNLHPMEENGGRCDWYRGLAHAHNWNKLQRYGDHFKMLGTANTFQPHGLHYMWDQGRIHYNSHQIWFMPSAYIDEAMITNWLPNVMKTTSSDERTVDITAKMDDSGKTLSLYVVNLSDEPREAVINIDNFRHRGKAEVWTIGGCDLTETNTDKDMFNVSPVTSQVSIAQKEAKYTFPRYSYTIITLTR